MCNSIPDYPFFQRNWYHKVYKLPEGYREAEDPTSLRTSSLNTHSLLCEALGTGCTKQGFCPLVHAGSGQIDSRTISYDETWLNAAAGSREFWGSSELCQGCGNWRHRFYRGSNVWSGPWIIISIASMWKHILCKGNCWSGQCVELWETLKCSVPHWGVQIWSAAGWGLCNHNRKLLVPIVGKV